MHIFDCIEVNEVQRYEPLPLANYDIIVDQQNAANPDGGGDLTRVFGSVPKGTDHLADFITRV